MTNLTRDTLSFFALCAAMLSCAALGTASGVAAIITANAHPAIACGFLALALAAFVAGFAFAFASDKLASRCYTPCGMLINF